MIKAEYPYTEEMAMSQVICDNYHLLLVITRFGIKLGFGERTIREVCEMNSVHTPTLLAVLNAIGARKHIDYTAKHPLEDIDIKGLISYLKESHHYFISYRLPLIREHLVSTLEEGPAELAPAILQFFDGYVKEVKNHMEYENNTVFPYVEDLIAGKKGDHAYSIDVYSHQHDQIEAKISELKNILIRYYPDGKGFSLTTILYDIFDTEEDLANHNHIEDDLFVPVIRSIEKSIK